MIGKTLGHYRVIQELGRGGMGEVFLADDISLDRKVALKFLPDAFTGDPERMARFEREAKLLASLNHPNIAAIYGLEQADGKRFIVMELVEGESLAQRLTKGALPVEEALGICRQIAEGLEAAHEKGVIHRDLKPANVMITEGDKVKILDFGLAKALSDETQTVDSSQSPTLTEAMTRPGVILGTAAYMSPEQAKGKTADKRTDIWAFGCILYECLTGKRVFEGETVTETLAAVLKNEPEWEALPATPPNIRFVLRRCLEKNMSQRFRDAADVRIEIEEARSIGESASPKKRTWFAWCIAAVFIITTLALSLLYFREKTPGVAGPIRFQFTPPASLDVGSAFAVSPNGRHLAFAASGSDGVVRLWIRAIDSLDARPITGTESSHIPPFFWSPDSRYIAFDAGGKLKKVDISGGLGQDICSLSVNAVGGSWNRDGVIIFGTYQSGEGLMRVSSAGGVASPLTKLDPDHGVKRHLFPSFLPDGKHFIYWQDSNRPEKVGVYIGSLDSKPEEQGSKQLLATTCGVVYAYSPDSGPGQILFLRKQTLMAQRFDDKRLELVGEAIPVAEQVGALIPSGCFSASTNGVLVYLDARAGSFTQAMWFDRRGKNLGVAGDLGVHFGLALSPDGQRAAVGFHKSNGSPNSIDLWLIDFAQGKETRFAFGRGMRMLPVWSPDGSRIIFAGNGGLYQKLVSGVKDEELLLKASDAKYPTSWSSDGGFLLYTLQSQKTKADLYVLPLKGDLKPILYPSPEFNEADGHFSTDMRWIAYESDESGRYEIYVRAFSKNSGAPMETGGKWQVSAEGGIGPRWRRDGKELYYRALDGKVMAVEVTSGTTFQWGKPKALFPVSLDRSSDVLAIPLSFWDVTFDGNRFLLSTPAAEVTPAPFTVVLNWQAGLPK